MNTNIRILVIVRLAIVLAWLVFTVLLLELPSDLPLIASLSSVFGKNEIGYALGHVVIFGITTFMLRWALDLFLAARAAVMWGVGIAGVLGIVTELLQFNTRYRGVTLLDLSANLVGVMLAGMWFAYRLKNSGET